MCSASVTLRRRSATRAGRDSTKSKQLALAKRTYRTKLIDLHGGVVFGSLFKVNKGISRLYFETLARAVAM